MKNLHLDSKILSTLSKILISKSLLFFGFLFLFLIVVVTSPLSFAEVFIPTNEYIGYFDSNRIYTVVGNVKNELDYAVIPTISVSVKDDSEIFSKTITHVPLGSGAEIPFKIKFPFVSNNPILLPANLSFEKTNKRNYSNCCTL